ncbi:hypothetical protein IHC93_17255 [Photobacterium damselae subsp. damselae]|uniref:hypothetical protein n=1 Tax=Photobacterium damselae TaxID=38293 RepID=UPI001F3A1282|nr:hypothetical protein [Photobacterium damselae]UKA27761.1 hypothetical protein IHC93_17255 [Photobacterium damselae subsp. damselae]
MKLSKITLSAIISISALSAMQAHSEEWPWDKATPSTAKAKWVGSAQIIPGSIHTITGKDGSLIIPDGKLTLNADGTFTSTPITFESHFYDETGIGDLVESSWFLDSARFDWGSENIDATAGIKITFIDQKSGIELRKDTPINADIIDLTVKNESPLTGIVNPSSEGTVEATIISQLIPH